MCGPVHSQDPLSPPAGSTNRSFLSRLTSPLRPRTRNLADFYIKPAEPFRQYSPGDTVKGVVVLAVIKPIRLTHLTVALHGFVRVYKNQNGATDVPTDLTTGSSRRAKYIGNGHASLFQDEIILCGDGRLDVGLYEFEFSLDFPWEGLPTSLDFERGTISYMIRSTITRPTSIGAATSCEQRVSLVETVDVGPMKPPEPRIISLEPISIRPKKHIKSKSKLEKTPIEAAQRQNIRHSADSTAAEESTGPRNSADNVPSSPHSATNFDLQSQSEHSSNNSFVSNSTGISFRFAQAPSSTKSAPRSQVGPINGSPAHGTITAITELLKAGCLPGDSIPLRISIQHTKWMKSLHGIIITLYRQARIDFAPPLSLFSDLKGKASEKLKHEEYYPKSKTGLGGLSLTSAGSSSVFRKDLSQTFAPIIIDPVTLSTVVTASLKVPEDVFPTITGVPGEMISFKYYIEVVIDLGGKLAGEDRHLPRLGLISLPSMTNSGGLLGKDGASAGTFAAWGGNIVNTDHVRREKSVVACLFDLVIGTTDSARLRGRGNLTTKQVVDDIPASPQSYSSRHDHLEEQHTRPRSPTEQHLSYQYDHQDMEQYYEHEDHYGYHNEHDDHPPMHHTPQYDYGFVPPPEIGAEESLNEKERVRRAEERLLPSQPPQEDQGSSRFLSPSAPEIDEDPEDIYTAPSTSLTYVNATSTLTATAPSAPPPEDVTPTGQPAALEDKHELERRRLMAEASSPADFPSDDNDAGEGSSGAAEGIGRRPQHGATAPTLTEDDEYEHHATVTERRETLPRYERWV